MRAKIRAIMEGRKKFRPVPVVMRQDRLGRPGKHPDEFYDAKLAELAPYWQEHLEDGYLLMTIWNRIEKYQAQETGK